MNSYRRVDELEQLSTKFNLNGIAVRLQMYDEIVLERIHLANDECYGYKQQSHNRSVAARKLEGSAVVRK